MPRHNPIDDTVSQRIARYADLVPYKDSMNRSENIPPEAMMMMSPDKVMPVMSPLGWEGRSKIAPVKGAPGLTITLAECPPGDSAGSFACRGCLKSLGGTKDSSPLCSTRWTSFQCLQVSTGISRTWAPSWAACW
jgi:hypothetical protein